MTQAITTRGGVPIAYEVRGAGPKTLVFVHGWSCDRSYWKEQLGPFSRDFKVVAIDLGGHGESGLGREDWSMESFGADVAAVAEALDLTQMVLIGHSMGGDVVMEAARMVPDRVSGLVWVDVYRQLDSFRAMEDVRKIMEPFRSEFQEATRGFVRGMFPPEADPSLVEWVAGDMSSAPTAVALPAMEAAFSFAPRIVAALPGLKIPVVAINPDPADVATLGRHGIEVLPIPGTGHFPMLVDPERFNSLLRKAIDRLP